MHYFLHRVHLDWSTIISLIGESLSSREHLIIILIFGMTFKQGFGFCLVFSPLLMEIPLVALPPPLESQCVPREKSPIEMTDVTTRFTLVGGTPFFQFPSTTKVVPPHYATFSSLQIVDFEEIFAFCSRIISGQSKQTKINIIRVEIE